MESPLVKDPYPHAVLYSPAGQSGQYSTFLTHVAQVWRSKNNLLTNTLHSESDVMGSKLAVSGLPQKCRLPTHSLNPSFSPIGVTIAVQTFSRGGTRRYVQARVKSSLQGTVLRTGC
ncbi:hypothetical protein KIL84_021680 [Mauremys mutica]|uniref:Uncharacterized protein n=1 Tax=Mauremys mutica TaxID=74926 RepID=A0A9D3X8N5_9SAUR|nr:hypothetical protein KIL84_021680 [Mauremys mutica]